MSDDIEDEVETINHSQSIKPLRRTSAARKKAHGRTKSRKGEPSDPGRPETIGGIGAGKPLNEYGMTARQEKFCLEYVKDFCGKRAAIRAGYSTHSAEVQASQLLSIPKIWERCRALKKEMFDRIDLSHERIIRELSAIAFANLADFLKVDPITGAVCLDIAGVMRDAPHLMAGITGYEVVEMSCVIGGVDTREVLKHRVKFDKLKALEMLMRHRGFFEPDDVLTAEELEALLVRQTEHLRQKRAILQAQLAMEKRRAGSADIEDDDFQAV